MHKVVLGHGGGGYISHCELTSLVNFELQKNNHCTAIGRLWQRVNCIPMGEVFQHKALIYIPCGVPTRSGISFAAWVC